MLLFFNLGMGKAANFSTFVAVRMLLYTNQLGFKKTGMRSPMSGRSVRVEL